MTPQFDTRPLSCKQRQQARVKSSYLPGFLRIAVSGAESNQPHAPSVVSYSSQGAQLSIAPISVRSFRSANIGKESRPIPTLSHGANVQPATLSWECRARCPATCYARTRQPLANSEKRIGCLPLPDLNQLFRLQLEREGRNQHLEQNGGMRTGQVWSIPTGIGALTSSLQR